ncbi:MAG: THUMP domain-containing protein [Candidatus Bathyarchaeota archaeon]|nr:THUMP domain-containing protein [Candidatus Bathyarchaeota archaeon]MCX8177559.1 THUMP domain-containing protein [Candidatus Bathyarchaeota archaeon]MDW8194351.1 THUMP domain-containing protein [Nitrososphaerota archaeon]
MLRDFNILATTSKGNETEACSELWYLLGEIGDPSPVVDKSGVSGLIVAKTSLRPVDVAEKLRAILRERPYEFRYLLRVIPIEKVVRTSLDEIKKAAAELSAKIRENETYRVTVEKRFTETSTRDIIEAAASAVNRKVNLEDPDKILLIEVVGGLTGMSVLKPQDILSIAKEKVL